MKPRNMFILLLVPLLLLTGCWDTINIEDRGFVVGSAIDIKEDDPDHPIFAITNQFVLPQGYAQNPAQQGGSSESFLNLTSQGQGIYRINDEMSARTSKSPYFGHMKVLILSEELARKEDQVVKVLDYYLRDVNIRRGVLLTVAKKKAKDVLNVKQPENQLPALNINQLIEQSSDKAGYFKALSIGDVEKKNTLDRSYVLPYLTIKDQVERTAGAVFNGSEKKMVGILGNKKLQGMELFSGTTKQNLIDFTFKDETFGLQIVRMRRKISIDTTNINHIKVKNKLKLEGVLKESKSNENFMKKNELKKVEKDVSKKIKKLVMESIHTAQADMHTDIFDIWEQVERKDSDTWEKVKDDWEKEDGYFSKADFDVDVETLIYSTGTTNQTR